MGLFQKKDKQQLLISSPEPPVRMGFLIFLRTFSVLYMLCTAILIHMAVVFRPWKVEWFKNKRATLEWGLWHVCRGSPKGERCYEGDLDAAPAWFWGFRAFFMISVVIQYLGAFFLMVKLLITKNGGSRQFWISAFVSLTSAICILTAMLMLIGYRELEFLEDSRMYRMGWRMDEIDVDEEWGWPHMLMWFNMALCLVGFFVCLYTHSKDSKWSKWYAMEGLRKQAQYMAR